jgi:uncharacterized protein DUF3800
VDIYIDESGDLGFTQQSSEYFVMAALVPCNTLPIQRCFKKIRQQKMKKKMKQVPELKYNNTPPEMKRRIFRCLASCDLDIAYLILHKRQVPLHIRDKHQIIYNYLAASLVSKITACYGTFDPVNVIIDQSLYGLQKEHFDDYLAYKMLEFPDNGIADRSRITIMHVDSQAEPCIQAVDFIAGAIHRKYRSDETTHYDLIREKMILERVLP